MDAEGLVAAARDAMVDAHAPYSGYRVGAAILAGDGTVYTGCNIEVANYSNSLHAEEVALAAAISSGQHEFTLLAVSTSQRDGVTPCGMCRQTLAEFCDDELRILCDAGDSIEEWTLGELLPAPITRDHVE